MRTSHRPGPHAPDSLRQDGQSAERGEQARYVERENVAQSLPRSSAIERWHAEDSSQRLGCRSRQRMSPQCTDD